MAQVCLLLILEEFILISFLVCGIKLLSWNKVKKFINLFLNLCQSNRSLPMTLYIVD